MNAHINRDLVQAIADTCDVVGIAPAHDSDQYSDFTALNALLEEVQDQVKREYATGLVGVADHLLGRLDDVVATWSVAAAREAAWSNAEVYWALPDGGWIEHMFLDTLDRSVGFAGRGLLVPALGGSRR
jgi:hypothetical protein